MVLIICWVANDAELATVILSVEPLVEDWVIGSVIVDTDDDTADDRLPTTLGVTAIALLHGADIIRVHDVNESYKMSKVIYRLLENNKK